MKPITYKKFDRKIQELGAEVEHRYIGGRGTVTVKFDVYTVGEVSKDEIYQMSTAFGYVDEFDELDFPKIIKLMVRLASTSMEDRVEKDESPKYKFKVPNSYPRLQDWVNINRDTKTIMFSTGLDTLDWQTEFTIEEIEELPIDLRNMVRGLIQVEVNSEEG